MLSEHLMYAGALSLFFGTLHKRFYSRNYSLLIILAAYAPDLDLFLPYLFGKLYLGRYVIHHGVFHNLVFVLGFAFTGACFLRILGMRFLDSGVFLGLGALFHLLEDALVYNPSYALLWPLKSERVGLGFFSYDPCILGVADPNVLAWGFMLAFFSLVFRASFKSSP